MELVCRFNVDVLESMYAEAKTLVGKAIRSEMKQ